MAISTSLVDQIVESGRDSSSGKKLLLLTDTCFINNLRVQVSDWSKALELATCNV